jgi:hypothetical protein
MIFELNKKPNKKLKKNLKEETKIAIENGYEIEHVELLDSNKNKFSFYHNGVVSFSDQLESDSVVSFVSSLI